MDSRRKQLNQQQCWQRLHAASVGRLAYTEFALPVIRAVPFVVDGNSVIVALLCSPERPAAFAKVTIVAFETGEWDPDLQEGWSVHFVGRAQAVPASERVRVRDRGLRSWIDGEPTLYVRAEASVLIGMQISPPDSRSPSPRLQAGATRTT